jgi:undecaprenyl diphosphate synthase
LHVAIIMDGNGRWASRRGLPRSAGHVEGAGTVCAVVAAAARAGIDTLTLHAFSAANWTRPSAEIDALMRLFRRFFVAQTPRCVERSIRIDVIGRRDRLSEGLLSAIERSEQLSAAGSRMHLRIALDYSSRESIVQAAAHAEGIARLEPHDFYRLLDEVNHCALSAGPVDLLIRTGGEKRLSDFMLWEVAYAELYFTDCLWPDFDEQRLQIALDDYANRQRRFGALTVRTG